MTELIEWFNNIFNNCYYVTHNNYPDKIFMYYDLRYVRKLKLCNIEKKECMPPKTISGECVFEQDWKNQYLWCKYSVIWKYLEDNYSSNYIDIQSFIKERLEEQDKMKVLTPYIRFTIMDGRVRTTGIILDSIIYENNTKYLVQTIPTKEEVEDGRGGGIITIFPHEIHKIISKDTPEDLTWEKRF